MCNLSEEIEERGVEKGIKKGIKKGEEKFAKLTKLLIDAGRTEDLVKATNDKEYRDSLYIEYGIK